MKEGWGGGLGKLPNGGERALDEEHWEKIASCLNATHEGPSAFPWPHLTLQYWSGSWEG